jgi:hypothetical protein
LLHEVGHDIDFDLGLSAEISKGLARQVENGQRRASWNQYLAEIIADTIGLYLAGFGYLNCLRDVVEPLLGIDGGWEPTAVHPPVLLRFTYLAALYRREKQPIPDGDELDRQIETHVRAKRFAEDLPSVVKAVLDTPLSQVGGKTLRDLLPDPGTEEKTWRGLPCSCRPADGDLARSVQDFERKACLLRPFEWQLGETYRTFLRDYVPRLAPTYSDPETLFKAPPLPLLTDYDRIAFVGATNGQLPALLAEAFELRDRKQWLEIELFFLDHGSLRLMATDDRPGDRLTQERDQALEDLSQALPRMAQQWAIYQFSEPYQFMSLWTKEQEGRVIERRVHTSAHIWGGDIRNAPATDYVDVNVGQSPQVKACFRGLKALKGRSGTTRLASSASGANGADDLSARPA